jgi:hypothetical protein
MAPIFASTDRACSLHHPVDILLPNLSNLPTL